MSIRRQMIYDETGHAIAIVVPIAEWREIAHANKMDAQPVDLARFSGLATFGGRDALEMQDEMRSEWEDHARYDSR